MSRGHPQRGVASTTSSGTSDAPRTSRRRRPRSTSSPSARHFIGSDSRSSRGLAFRWLRPGGCLATLGLDGRFEGDAPWQQTVSRVADEYRARAFPDGWAEVLPGEQNGTEAREAAMRGAGFVDIEEHALEVPHAWTFDELAGYLESTSTCSRRALGVHFEPFIEALRSALTADASSTFPEVVRWGYTLARKPA